MSEKLTSAEKSLLRAEQIACDLACDPLQTTLDQLALTNARRGLRVAKAMMSAKVAFGIETKLATAKAMLALTESQVNTLRAASKVLAPVEVTPAVEVVPATPEVVPAPTKGTTESKKGKHL